MCEKVINFIKKAMKNWKLTAVGKKNFSREENPERHLPERCVLSIILCDRNDANQLYILEMPPVFQINKITRKKINQLMYKGMNPIIVPPAMGK